MRTGFINRLIEIITKAFSFHPTLRFRCNRSMGATYIKFVTTPLSDRFHGYSIACLKKSVSEVPSPWPLRRPLMQGHHRRFVLSESTLMRRDKIDILATTRESSTRNNNQRQVPHGRGGATERDRRGTHEK